MHFINAILQNSRSFNVSQLMYLQQCYFKAPLFHYKTLLVHDSSIGSSESPAIWQDVCV